MLRNLSPLLALASIAPAQTQFTSPPGIGADGSSSVSFLQPFVTSASGRRYQYVLGDIAAVPASGGEQISALALRPDPTAGTSAARTVDLTLVMDHADVGALSATFAANYSGSETVTMSATALNLPATSGGSGFAIALPLSAPFTYLGDHHPTPARSALLVEFRTANVSAAGAYTLDCVDGTLAEDVGTSTYLGLEGCVVAPNTAPFDIYKRGPTSAGGMTTCGVYGQRAPQSAAGILSIGVTDPNSTFAGLLCAPLRAAPDVVALITATSATGTLGSAAIPIDLVLPDLFAGQGVRFYPQFAVLAAARVAPALPVALSDAVQWDLTAPNPVPRRLIYSNAASTAAIGTTTLLFVPVLRCN